MRVAASHSRPKPARPPTKARTAAGVLPASYASWPLRANAGQRYLEDQRGTPFLLHADTAWGIVGQLTNAQIDQYLSDRARKGLTGLIFSAPEAFYTSQTPAYNNVDGVAPFNPATSFTNPVEAYWTRVDYLVNRARQLGMVCIINPAYLGYVPSGDGWWDAVSAVSDANLQTYGAWLANRYTQGNIIWCLLGDDDNGTRLTKQWNIVTGMRTVRTTDLIMVHPLSDDTDADDGYTYANGQTGFNLNSVYGYEDNSFFVYELMAQLRTRPIPGGFMEGQYENANGATTAMMRRQFYGGILGGGCYVIYGNHPIWHFNSSRWTENPNGAWQDHLNDTGLLHQVIARQLVMLYPWWLLEPKTDTSLVTGSLGSDAARIYPALASDGSVALIYVPTSQTVNVNLDGLAAANVRIRLFDPTTGSFTTHTASTTSSGTINIATGGERVIVIDAA